MPETNMDHVDRIVAEFKEKAQRILVKVKSDYVPLTDDKVSAKTFVGALVTDLRNSVK